MARVSLVNLSKHFRDVKAVDSLSLEIPEGSFITLLGPSGCGKSTTLYCIAGLDEATSGDILFDGKSVKDLSPKERDAALVFQDYALYPHMTVYDNLGFALKMRKTSKSETKTRINQVAELLGISRLLDRRPAQLSGGQRQRVALGRAMIRNASVFLMDEPLSNLDALLRVNTRTEIKRLQRELGKTTIFVTHDQEEAMVLSDRIAIMRDGMLQQYGTPAETYNAPVNTFVAGFIGNPRMNFMTGELTTDDGSAVITSDNVHLPVPGLRALELGKDRRRLSIGFRPEHVHVRPVEAGLAVASVELIEPVGPVTYLDLQIGGQSFRASVAGNLHHQIGEKVSIALDPEALHFFDPDNGLRLSA